MYNMYFYLFCILGRLKFTFYANLYALLSLFCIVAYI